LGVSHGRSVGRRESEWSLLVNAMVMLLIAATSMHIYFITYNIFYYITAWLIFTLACITTILYYKQQEHDF